MTGLLYWTLFALLAPLLWAASNLIDERLLKETDLDPWALLLVTGCFASLPALALLTGRWAWPGTTTALMAFGAGILGVAVYFPYLRALSLESAPSVLLMWNLTPVLIVGLARFGLRERLAVGELVAVALLVASSLAAAYRRSTSHTTWSAAFPWMLVASVVLAIGSVLEKAVYATLSFTEGLPWISLGAVAFTLPTICIARGPRERLRQSFRGRLAVVLVFNEAFDVVATLCLALATSLGPVSLVHAVGGTQPLLVLLLRPIFGRRHARRPWELVRTVFATGLAIIGLVLLHSTI